MPESEHRKTNENTFATICLQWHWNPANDRVPRAPVGIAAVVFPVTRTLMAHALSIISDKLSCTVLRLPSSSRKVLILSDQTRQRTRLSVSCRFPRIVWDRNALSAEIAQLLKDTSLPFFRRNFINLPHVLLSLSLSRYLCLPLSISQRELMASMLFLFIFFFLSLSHRGDVYLCQEACVSPEDVQLGSSWLSSINCIDSSDHCNLYAQTLSCTHKKYRDIFSNCCFFNLFVFVFFFFPI